MAGKVTCSHLRFNTAISAMKQAKEWGLAGHYREVMKCKSCGKWRVREGLT